MERYIVGNPGLHLQHRGEGDILTSHRIAGIGSKQIFARDGNISPLVAVEGLECIVGIRYPSVGQYGIAGVVSGIVEGLGVGQRSLPGLFGLGNNLFNRKGIVKHITGRRQGGAVPQPYAILTVLRRGIDEFGLRPFADCLIPIAIHVGEMAIIILPHAHGNLHLRRAGRQTGHHVFHTDSIIGPGLQLEHRRESHILSVAHLRIPRHDYLVARIGNPTITDGSHGRKGGSTQSHPTLGQTRYDTIDIVCSIVEGLLIKELHILCLQRQAYQACNQRSSLSVSKQVKVFSY